LLSCAPLPRVSSRTSQITKLSAHEAAPGRLSTGFCNEKPFFDKPVLFHQLQGTAMRLTGHPEFGARLVPSLAALGLMAITIRGSSTA
jgi:4-amino-4-deoxy-L-arabinose transferase-like glycosyltransferase